MKNLINLTLAILLLASCKDSPESSSSKNARIVEGVMNEVTGKNDHINETYDVLLVDLRAKTPLTEKQLLEAFPKTNKKAKYWYEWR
ncbi:hypothetical protein ES711_03770 [Gelidibacter salicanalis]|uniref:Uncharacterized protein n=1 Tax=Gelidibacter salicanalis TaxID=291193 RepID=A0A5C7AN76_9FLAO|nr:hypothetical protein [Gelidibacter salicanalis]TXE09063.1 hypothetical protein ES711_03770 [Gelidibacter salicanalis]